MASRQHAPAARAQTARERGRCKIFRVTSWVSKSIETFRHFETWTSLLSNTRSNVETLQIAYVSVAAPNYVIRISAGNVTSPAATADNLSKSGSMLMCDAWMDLSMALGSGWMCWVVLRHGASVLGNRLGWSLIDSGLGEVLSYIYLGALASTRRMISYLRC